MMDALIKPVIKESKDDPVYMALIVTGALSLGLSGPAADRSLGLEPVFQRDPRLLGQTDMVLPDPAPDGHSLATPDCHRAGSVPDRPSVLASIAQADLGRPRAGSDPDGPFGNRSTGQSGAQEFLGPRPSHPDRHFRRPMAFYRSMADRWQLP